jgi:hypothetical protein
MPITGVSSGLCVCYNAADGPARLARYIGRYAQADSDANHAGFASHDEGYITLHSILQFSGPDRT